MVPLSGGPNRSAVETSFYVGAPIFPVREAGCPSIHPRKSYLLALISESDPVDSLVKHTANERRFFFVHDGSEVAAPLATLRFCACVVPLIFPEDVLVLVLFIIGHQNR